MYIHPHRNGVIRTIESRQFWDKALVYAAAAYIYLIYRANIPLLQVDDIYVCDTIYTFFQDDDRF